MIGRPEPHTAPRPLVRRLMVGGLGLWGLSVGGAFVPGILRTVLYPNHAGSPRFEMVAADALGAPFLWSAFVCWGLSWAFVVGYVPATWTDPRVRRPWVSRALLLGLSLVSPLVFGFAVSVLLQLATHDAWHADRVLPYLPAVLVQLAISQAYSVLVGLRTPAAIPRAEGA